MSDGLEVIKPTGGMGFLSALMALGQQRIEEKRMAETLAKVQDGVDNTHNQWVESHGAYTRAGKTHGKLPPGVYDIAVTQEGLFFVPVQSKTGELLRFPEAVIDDVMNEVETFWDREEKFRQYDVSFRRGLLLHGEPGAGKSCTLQLIAEDVVTRGGIVLLWNTSPENFLAAYREFRRVQPETKVVVFLEDLDGLLETYKSRESLFLNILDGIERMDRVIFVATTNYIEYLAARVSNRPSRFDRLFEVKAPSPESRKMYLESLIRGEEDFDIERVVKDTQGWSLAHLKELFTSVVIMGGVYSKVYTRITDMFVKKHSSDAAVEQLSKGKYI